MTLVVSSLSEAHLAQLDLAVTRAAAQWVANVVGAEAVASALERVVLFLRQNGGAERQARQVASLAFLYGQQVVAGAGWRWASVSDDGTVNPAVVSPDGARALLVVDAATGWVLGASKVGLRELLQACASGASHPDLVALRGPSGAPAP